MKLKYDDIIIKKRKLLYAGDIVITNTGINLIRGKNGTGKTMLLKNIYFNNKENAVIIDQDNNEIINELSIIENIVMNDEEKLKSEAIEILTAYGLKHLLELDPKKLSGGEKRIISILRGILSDATLILMDEPTNDLDYVMVQKLVNILLEYSDTKGFLIITHDDRLNAVAKRVFLLENQTITLYDSSQIIDGLSDHSGIVGKYIKFDNSKLLYKIFKRKYFSIFLILLLCFLSIYKMQDIKDLQNKIITKIHPRQVDIFIPLSITGQQVMLEGALPIGVVEYMKSKTLSKNIKAIIESASNAAINYGLNIKNTGNCTVYPLEYYEVNQRKYFFTLDTYLSDVLNVDTQSASVDTSSIFTWNGLNKITEKKYPFDKNIFEKSIGILENRKSATGENLEILYLIVILDDNLDVFDFIKQSGLQSGNYYFRSNETIELTNQILAFEGYRNISIILFLASLLMVALDILYTYLLMHINSKKISILVNYGFEQSNLEQIISDKFIDKYFRLISSVLLILFSALMNRKNGQWELLGNYLIPMLFIFTLCASYKIDKKIIMHMINKIYNWRYR